MAKSPIAPAGSPPKRRRKKAAPVASPDMDLSVTAPDPMTTMPITDPDTGSVAIPTDDGGVIVDFDPRPDMDDDYDETDHGANLARVISWSTLNTLGEELLEGIQADEDSRMEWMSARAKGIDMLGLKVEDPKSSVGTTAPLEGMSTVRDPLMLEAVLRFQANAQGEMLPASGPVKVVDFGSGQAPVDDLAESLETDLNYYLTSTATEYYPDTRRMFFWTGFSGLAFKKIYRCPLRRRPVSESVDAADLIVSDDITDLKNAQRITHQISMRPSVMKRMQILGVYLNVDLQQPQPDPNPVKEKIAKVQGVQARSERPQDQTFTVYECYCELDLEGFEHKDSKGNPTGLPLPYRVTIEKDSRQVLEIRRNWNEDDEDYQSKVPFVAFPYATGLGFYGIGLLHILGNMTNALTALTREAIDAGMFANFPGFLYAKQNGRQMTNEFRIPPGGGVGIETNGNPIAQTVMPLPYKEMGPATMALIESLRNVGQRVGGTADTPVGEGKQDAPVGTTLALIEQATKIEGAVHKSLHAAQAEEFKLLCELFRDDPESLWRGNKRSALGKDPAKFIAALERCDIVPQADPNVASHMQRVMNAQALRTMAMTAPPGTYDIKQVDGICLKMMNMDVAESVFAQPMPAAGPPPVDPLKVAELHIKNKQADTNQLKVVTEAHNKVADRQSAQNIEVLKLAQTQSVHPESAPIVDQQITALAPFLTPTPQSQPQPPPMPSAGGLGPLPPMVRPQPFRPPLPGRGLGFGNGFPPFVPRSPQPSFSATGPFR